MMSWNGSAVNVVATGKSGTDRGGYCTFQSGFALCGQSSEGFKKWDTRNDTMTLVGNGTDPNGPGGDFDFATTLGNLVFLGNDHGTGSALIPHQGAMDTIAPEVLKIYPSEARQPLSSRVTIFFSEDLDLDTVIPANILVRTAGGAPVPGVFSRSSFNAISFGPKGPLAPNTTYEVSIPAGGVADLVGNRISVASSVRFSTGATIEGPVTPPEIDAGTHAHADAGAGPVDSGALTATDAATPGSVTAPDAGSAIADAPSAADARGAGCSLRGRRAPAGVEAMAAAAMLLGLSRRRGRNRRRDGAERA
jgi:hypothetical protein